jgi:hypothetical protein
MKTSLGNLQLMEDWLLGRASGSDQAVFAARQLLDPALREDAYWQRKTYSIVREYGRQRLRQELEHLHRELFTAPQHQSFRERVLAFFPK